MVHRVSGVDRQKLNNMILKARMLNLADHWEKASTAKLEESKKADQPRKEFLHAIGMCYFNCAVSLKSIMDVNSERNIP